MSYENRRMAMRQAALNGPAGPIASIDPLGVALAARAAPTARSATAAPPAVGEPEKPWAGDFYRAAEGAGLPLTTLNSIVAVCGSQAEAMEKVKARAAGAVAASPRARDDASIVTRISASHAKAHQPRRGATRH